MDLALSLARIVGDERQFIRTLRQIRQDPGTTTAQALETTKHKIDSMETLFDECIDLWAHNNLEGGSIALAGILRQLPKERGVGLPVSIVCLGTPERGIQDVKSKN